MAEPSRPLAPAELAAQLDAILTDAEDLVRAASRQALEQRSGREGLSVLDVAYRIFRLGLAFADAMDFGRLRERWLDERAPADLEDGAAVARYAALVRGRLGGWIEGACPGEYARAIEVPWGAESGHDLLRWITGCAAEDLRELQACLSPYQPPSRLEAPSRPHEDA